MLDFAKASEGLKKIYKGEIFELISALLAIVAILAMAGTTVAALGESMGGTIAGASLTLVIIVAALVLSICSFILILIGLNKVGKENKWCKIAFILIFVDIVLQIVLSLVGKGNFVSFVSSLCNAIVMILIIQGCMDLNKKKNNLEMVEKGKKVLYVIIIANAISIISSFIITIATPLTTVLAGIGALVSVVGLICAYVKFLKYLKMTAATLID